MGQTRALLVMVISSVSTTPLAFSIQLSIALIANLPKGTKRVLDPLPTTLKKFTGGILRLS